MSCPKEARKRCKTISSWLTPGQLAEIDELVRLSGLTKQDYLTRCALDKQVVVVPSSRVVKSLKCYAERIVNKLDALTVPAQLDDDILLDEIRCLSGLMAAHQIQRGGLRCSGADLESRKGVDLIGKSARSNLRVLRFS